jgi:thiamine biosynthesis protein ThiS
LEIVINGELRQFASSLSVAELLKQLDAEAPHVAVEVNEQLVPRAQHTQCQLANGDHIEIVTLVGGG